MKKILLTFLLFIPCLISLSFAANRTDKYQAIKEGGEYYNKLQEIYQDEDYQSRHNKAVYDCKRNQDICFKNSTIYTNGLCLEVICTMQSLGMAEEEQKIYNYVEVEDTVSERAIRDNECYQSMKGYFDEKEDGCLCENGTHLENNICVEDEVKDEVEETQAEEINQSEIVEEIKEKAEVGKVENIDKAKEENTKKDIPELNRAINWMHDNGLTIFNDPESFMYTNGLRRDEASKFFVKYAKEVMGQTPDYSKQGCSFKDLDKAWPDLKDIIVEACQLGLFQGYKGNFMPDQLLTNAQALTVFMRLREGYKDESGSHFANNYYESAHAQGFLFDTPLDNKANFDTNTTRGDVAKMLFRGQENN